MINGLEPKFAQTSYTHAPSTADSTMFMTTPNENLGRFHLRFEAMRDIILHVILVLSRDWGLGSAWKSFPHIFAA